MEKLGRAEVMTNDFSVAVWLFSLGLLGVLGCKTTARA